MAYPEKELEDELLEVGKSLFSPLYAVDELLSILDKTESLLSRVEQSPSHSMLTALDPVMKALVAKELSGHSDMDVKVAVASCISEITRITAPDAPYEDDPMKEIFQLIVEAFENLDDESSRSYPKRVSILETVAKVRSCVVMLDLECDALILEMFQHFLKTIRSSHSENVFSSMETIMTLVLEETEDIPLKLLTCLLISVKNDNKDVLPIARKLGEKVIVNCSTKFKPYLVELIQTMGAPLSDYSKVVASICQETSDHALEHNDLNASGECLADDSKLSERTVSDELPQGSVKLDPEVGCPEEVDTAADKSPRSVMSNGTVAMGNGDSFVEPSSPKQKPERARRSGQSKVTLAVTIAEPNNLDTSVAVKQNSMSDCSTKKTRGRKSDSSIQLKDATEHSRVDSKKEALVVPSGRKGRNKEADSSQSEGPSSKEAEATVILEPEKKTDLLPPAVSDNQTVVTSSTPSEILPVTTRPRRGRLSGSKVTPKRGGVNAVADQPGSPSGQKEATANDLTADEALPLRDTDFRKEPEGITDSEGKQIRHSGKKVPAGNADDGETPIPDISANKGVGGTSDTEAKPLRQVIKKGSTRKVAEGESSRKQQKGKVALEKDVCGELSLKEMVSSPMSTKKALNKDQSPMEESLKMKSRRKRLRETEEVPETPHPEKALDETLVGSKIKVWWPTDKRFYEGIIDSYNPVTNRHTVVYNDGDLEILVLKLERWELIEGDTKTDGGKQGKTKDISTPYAFSKVPQNKKAKTSPDSKPKQARTETLLSGGTSVGKPGAESADNRGGDVPKPMGRRKGGVPNPGGISNDETPTASSKSKEKAVHKDKDETHKSGSKSEPGNKPKDDTPKPRSKLKDTPKTGNKLKDDPPKIGSKLKDDPLKSSSKSKDDFPKIRNKSKDGTVESGRKSIAETPKNVQKPKDDALISGRKKNGRKSNDVARKPVQKPKAATSTTPKADGKSDENGDSVSGKSKVSEIENSTAKVKSNSGKAEENEAKSRKKRRRKT